MSTSIQRENRVLTFFRKTHTWIGIIILAFVVIIGGTGRYLNHRKFFNPMFSSGKNGVEKARKTDSLTPSHPVTREEASLLANSIWKNRSIRKSSTRKKGGYRISKGNKRSIIIDSATGY